MNNQINLKRVVLLAKLSFVLNKKRIAYTAMAGLGIAFVLTILPIVVGQTRSLPIFKDHEFNFMILLFVFGAIYAGSSFNAHRSKAGITEYLMVPASSLEKFLGEALLTVGFSIAAYIVYWLYALTVNWILGSVIDAFFMPFNLDLSYYGLALAGYLCLLGVFQFGAITFRQMPFLKILLWSVPFIIVVFVLNRMSALNQNSLIGFDEHAFRSIITTRLIVYRFYLSVPVGLLFWALTYLKLKEKEA